MKKIILSFVAIMAITAAIIFFTKSSNPIPNNGSVLGEALTAQTITDQRGKTINLPLDPKRIVTLPKPLPAVLYALGVPARSIIGMHPASKQAIENNILDEMAPELFQASTDFVSSGFNPNVEEVLKLQPDLVFQWAHKGSEIIEPMERAGLNVVGMTYGSQDELESLLTMLGQIFNKSSRADELINYHQNSRKAVIEKTMNISDGQKPKILYLSYGSELRTRGLGMYQHEQIELAGGYNLARELAGDQEVSMEQIITWDPDIIYLDNFNDELPELFIDDSIPGQHWSGITAVKNKQVYKIPLGTFSWGPPSQESPLMWHWLLAIQQPQLVDYNLRQQIHDFYDKYYNYSLTENQLNQILHCQTNNNSLAACQ